MPVVLPPPVPAAPVAFAAGVLVLELAAVSPVAGSAAAGVDEAFGGAFAAPPPAVLGVAFAAGGYAPAAPLDGS